MTLERFVIELRFARGSREVSLREWEKWKLHPIKTDEAMVARAKKAMAIALTVLDDQGTPKSEPT